MNNGQYQPQYQYAPVPPVEQNKKNSGLAITSMILGILSVLGCCCCFGTALGIAAIICACVDRGHNGGKFSGMALAGLLCGIGGLAFSVISTVLVIVFRSDIMTSFEATFDSYDNISPSFYD